MIKTFAHHTPSQEATDKIRTLRGAYSTLAEIIEHLAPNSREKAVAKTELETSAMWAIKAIAVNSPDSVVEQYPADAPQTGDAAQPCG